MNILVNYNGKYPNACIGTLTIMLNGEQVYSSKYECMSTGACNWDSDEKEEIIRMGLLKWNDDHEWQDIPDDPEIREAITEQVAFVLKQTRVCCGGCI